MSPTVKKTFKINIVYQCGVCKAVVAKRQMTKIGAAGKFLLCGMFAYKVVDWL